MEAVEGRSVYEIIDAMVEFKTTGNYEEFKKYIDSITEEEWERLEKFATTLGKFAGNMLESTRRTNQFLKVMEAKNEQLKTMVNNLSDNIKEMIRDEE